MWSNLPMDVLAHIFSFLPSDSLARAMSSCHHWHDCVLRCTALSETQQRHHPPWFLALSTRSGSCFLLNPIDRRWRLFPLDFVPYSARPIASIGGLLLLKSTTNKNVQLHICNPFTKQFRNLPLLHIRRTNPALGLVDLGPSQRIGLPHFRIYAAGGMSELIIGRASYEPTLEMYDSEHDDAWRIIGSMPVEFAVRLTVWTPNESVYINGILYWITSARAYSVMGFEIGQNKWKEFSVPMADTLEFATLVPRNGKLTLVGGTSGGGEVCIWELDDDEWKMIERMPSKMGKKLLGGKSSWGGCIKCVGIEGAVCLYSSNRRDLVWSGMVIWREVVEEKGNKWKWFWMEGGDCNTTIRGKLVDNCPLKGLLLHPNLSPSLFHM